MGKALEFSCQKLWFFDIILYYTDLTLTFLVLILKFFQFFFVFLEKFTGGINLKTNTREGLAMVKRLGDLVNSEEKLVSYMILRFLWLIAIKIDKDWRPQRDFL